MQAADAHGRFLMGGGIEIDRKEKSLKSEKNKRHGRVYVYDVCAGDVLRCCSVKLVDV